MPVQFRYQRRIGQHSIAVNGVTVDYPDTITIGEVPLSRGVS